MLALEQIARRVIETEKLSGRNTFFRQKLLKEVIETDTKNIFQCKKCME